MTLRRLRWILILYATCDFLIGYAGVIPLSQAAAAQFTQVTGTVIDPNSIPYAFGTISATLVSSASPTLNGLPYTPPTQPTGLDQNGKFLMQLADNTALLPGATQWKFTVCSTIGTVQPSIGKGPVCFTAGPITISGTSQDITATLNAAALALTLSSGGGTTINPTNGVIPVRANATTFNDSPLSVASGNVSDSGNLTVNGTPAATTFNSVTLTSQVNSFTTLTDTAANSDTGFNNVTIVNPAGASGANFYGYATNLQTPAANTQNFSLTQSGYYCQTQHNGSGNLTYAGIAGGLTCYLASSLHNGSGTITINSAFNGTVQNIANGTITTNAAFVATTGSNVASTGTITNDYGFLAQPPAKVVAAPMTHHYAFRAPAGQTGGSGNPDGWAFFSDAADKSQFGLTTLAGTTTAQAPILAQTGSSGGNTCLAANMGIAFTGSLTSGLAQDGAQFPALCSNGARILEVGPTGVFITQPLQDLAADSQLSLTTNSASILGTSVPNGQIERGFNVNVTPVTVSANVTTDQNLMAVTIPAGNMNVVGRTFRVFVAGVYSTPAASTATITIELKLCSVSGCAAGNVADLIDATSSANPGTVTNNAFNLTAYFTTQTAGAAGRWEAHGVYGIDLGALNTSPDSFFNDTNTAVIAGTPADIDTTAQNFLQVSIAFSAASASNSATERQLVVEMVN